MNGWIGVDLDGTLAHYDGWKSAAHVGAPVIPMVERVKRWLTEGREVRIFTARMYPFATTYTAEDTNSLRALNALSLSEREKDAVYAVLTIQDWCRQHIGQVLPITNVKDYGMIELWDDRAVQVRPNTGEVVGASTRGLE